MPYIPHTEQELASMLSAIGVKDLDALFSDISPELRAKNFIMPKGQSESNVCSYLEGLAAKNNTNLISFLGAGFYAHDIPKAVDALSGRSEFYTAYTPYQSECSQGTLQAIFEFQTAVSRLFEMDCANASVYDGGTALFEAAMMAVRSTKRRMLLIDEAVNPVWRVMLATYLANLDIELKTVPQNDGMSNIQGLISALDEVGEQCAAIMVQNPNFFGVVSDFSAVFAKAKEKKTFGIISVYPIMQAILKTPGEMEADVAVAEGQSLGQPLNFGGPYLGLMACKKEHIRQFPGRIVGRTKDRDGKDAYVLTLQAREQHIRRAKATSNICSNQALCALRSLIHMCILGPNGLVRLAEHNIDLAHYAAKRLSEIKGVELLNNAPFCNEFAIKLPIAAEEVINTLTTHGCVPGYPVGRYYEGYENVLLLACTEINNRRQIGILAETLGGIL